MTTAGRGQTKRQLVPALLAVVALGLAALLAVAHPRPTVGAPPVDVRCPSQLKGGEPIVTSDLFLPEQVPTQGEVDDACDQAELLYGGAAAVFALVFVGLTAWTLVVGRRHEE